MKILSAVVVVLIAIAGVAAVVMQDAQTTVLNKKIAESNTRIMEAEAACKAPSNEYEAKVLLDIRAGAFHCAWQSKKRPEFLIMDPYRLQTYEPPAKKQINSGWL